MTTEALPQETSLRDRINTDSIGEGLLGLERFLRPNEGWLAASLLVLNLVVVVLSVEQADWAPSPNLVFLLFLAMITGLALYRLPVWSLVLVPVGLAVGLGVILWQLSMFTFDGASAGGAGQVIERLDLWLEAARTGSINIDRLPFSFGLMVATWLTGFLGAWLFLRFGNFWGVFVLGGIGLLSNLTFLPPNAAFHLGFYLFTAMLLVARVQAMRRKDEWELRAVKVDEHLGGLSLSDSFAVAVVVIVVAFLLPMAPRSGVVNDAYEGMRSPLESFEGDFNRLFAGLPARKPLGFRIWDDVMALQGSIYPTTTQVLWVDSPAELYWKARTYNTYNGKGWLSEHTVTEPIGYTPEFSLGTADRLRTDVTYTVTPLYASKKLFSGDMVLDVDRGVLIETQAPPVYSINVDALRRGVPIPSYLEDLGQAILEVVEGIGASVNDQALAQALPPQFRLDEVVREQGSVLRIQVTEALPPVPEVLSVSHPDGKFKNGEPYQVTSAISLAAPVQLRGSGEDYPAWVWQRYTQLPDSLPQRVRDLTAAVVRDAKTPYDKAKAVERFLQNNYDYNLRVDPPPYNADGVEHFLFTLKEGYSEYFASTMSVMLRTVDVPARLAVGYTTGTRVEGRDVFAVTDSNNHAWVEVYFPNFGWIPFEPTPGESLPGAYQPDSERRSLLTGNLTDASALDDGCFDDFDDFEDCGDEEPTLPVGGAAAGRGQTNPVLELWPWALLALGAAVVLYGLARLLWNRFMAVSTSPRIMFNRLSTLATLAAAGPVEFQTPYQFGRRLEEVLPGQGQSVSVIVGAYVRTRYGKKPPTASERRMMSLAWRSVRLRMLWAAVKRRTT
ncbi:MAG: hypothetical protein CL732_05975 [Chloroflexi bacterium]|nr:hypothetical protein [Chloroflexota bacterium]